MERKSFVPACDCVGADAGDLCAGFVLRAGKITLRSPLRRGSKPVQFLQPEARHLQCSVFAGSSAAALLTQADVWKRNGVILGCEQSNAESTARPGCRRIWAETVRPVPSPEIKEKKYC